MLKAYQEGLPIPNLITAVLKEEDPQEETKWSSNFKDTSVKVERVIAYWSRTLKSAERNYSPTEREALSLREPYIEGEKILAVTDYAALVWSRTFQNMNRRLLTWGTVFSAYPDLQIIHRAGRVHSNVDPISRLRWRVPLQEGPNSDRSAHTILNSEQESLTNFFEELTPKFEARTLGLVAQFEEEREEPEVRVMYAVVDSETHPESDLSLSFQAAKNYSLLSAIHPLEIKEFISCYDSDPYFYRVYTELRQEQGTGCVSGGKCSLPRCIQLLPYTPQIQRRPLR